MRVPGCLSTSSSGDCSGSTISSNTRQMFYSHSHTCTHLATGHCLLDGFCTPVSRCCTNVQRSQCSHAKIKHVAAHDHIVSRTPMHALESSCCTALFPRVATIFTQRAAVAAHGNSAWKIHGGSKRGGWRSQRPFEARNVSLTPATEIVNPMPTTQGPGDDHH